VLATKDQNPPYSSTFAFGFIWMAPFEWTNHKFCSFLSPECSGGKIGENSTYMGWEMWNGLGRRASFS